MHRFFKKHFIICFSHILISVSITSALGLRFEYPVLAVMSIEESDKNYKPELGFSAALVAGERDFFWTFGYSPLSGKIKGSTSVIVEGIEIEGFTLFKPELHMVEVGFGCDLKNDPKGSAFLQVGAGIGSGKMEFEFDWDFNIIGENKTGKADVLFQSDRAFAFSFFLGGGYRWGHFEFYSNLKYSWFTFIKDPYEYTINMDDGSSVIAPVVNSTKENGKVFQINLGIGYSFCIPEKKY